jgi:transposase
MEERRMRAAEMFAAGDQSQADIGRKLAVSHQTVSDWHAVWRNVNIGRKLTPRLGSPTALRDHLACGITSSIAPRRRDRPPES